MSQDFGGFLPRSLFWVAFSLIPIYLFYNQPFVVQDITMKSFIPFYCMVILPVVRVLRRPSRILRLEDTLALYSPEPCLPIYMANFSNILSCCWSLFPHSREASRISSAVLSQKAVKLPASFLSSRYELQLSLTSSVLRLANLGQNPRYWQDSSFNMFLEESSLKDILLCFCLQCELCISAFNGCRNRY